MNPDKLCSLFVESGLKMLVRDLDEELVLIEGEPDAIELLGMMLIAQAHFARDDGMQMGPISAGNALFAPVSTRGLYVHVLRKATP